MKRWGFVFLELRFPFTWLHVGQRQSILGNKNGDGVQLDGRLAKGKFSILRVKALLRNALNHGYPPSTQIKEKTCSTCHDEDRYLKSACEKKLMLNRYVTNKNAGCFDCCLQIKHRNGEVNQPLPGDCAACHSQPRCYQRLLAAGPEREGGCLLYPIGCARPERIV